MKMRNAERGARNGENQASPIAQWLGADQCVRKRRYADKRDAQTALNSFSKFRGRHGRPEQLRAYHCDLCQGWHLTKKV